MNRILVSLTIATLLCAAASIASAQEAFKTPEDAANALVSAAKAGNMKVLATVLGPDGDAIVSSGDKVADATTRQKFVAAYEAKHQINREGDNNATLVIGSDDYPLPIPIVRKDGMWRFDTVAGRQEILARRIGKDELDAIQSCLAYVDAQNDYAAKDRTGVYAQRIVSRPGKKDGLYWPTSQGEDPSPLGELIAEATAQGYRVGAGRTPYHGYYFKILTKQGAAAPGGELEYIVRGKMIGGFALVAYPAEYRNSGVMTFIVSYEGTVFQKDLGPDTAKLAQRMTSFNPDKTWQKVTDTAPIQ
jgi:nicotinamidase-related amidase